MVKTALRACAVFILCVLLVYAPEIYTAVSGPYESASAERVLLRITLCTQDDQSADAFYDALNTYMKEFPTVHLRVTRTDMVQLFSQPDPQPDVFVFPSTMQYDAAQHFAPVASDDRSAGYVAVFSPQQGEALLCGVYLNSNNKASAFALLECLEAFCALDKTAAPGI